MHAIHHGLDEGHKDEQANCHSNHYFKHPIVVIHHAHILTDTYQNLKPHLDDEDGRYTNCSCSTTAASHVQKVKGMFNTGKMQLRAQMVRSGPAIKMAMIRRINRAIFMLCID